MNFCCTRLTQQVSKIIEQLSTSPPNVLLSLAVANALGSAVFAQFNILNVYSSDVSSNSSHLSRYAGVAARYWYFSTILIHRVHRQRSRQRSNSQVLFWNSQAWCVRQTGTTTTKSATSYLTLTTKWTTPQHVQNARHWERTSSASTIRQKWTSSSASRTNFFVILPPTRNVKRRHSIFQQKFLFFLSPPNVRGRSTDRQPL